MPNDTEAPARAAEALDLDAIDGELLDTAECTAITRKGVVDRCTHTRCLLRERNSLAGQAQRLRARVAALEAENAKLREDAARIDWLVAHDAWVSQRHVSKGRYEFVVECFGNREVAYADTWREAIDAARRAP